MFVRRIPTRIPRLSRAYASSSGYNDDLVEKIRQVAENDKHLPINRTRSLLQGADILSKIPYRLTTSEMVLRLPIGTSCIKILTDILPSGEPPDISEKEKKALMKEMKSVNGLSIPCATQLINAGCRSKDDLLLPQYFNMLTPIVQQNVRLASHLEQPVLRTQIETIADFIRYVLPTYEVIPVGNYRRAALSSPSANILLINPELQHVSPPPRPPSGYLHPIHSETLLTGYIRESYLQNTAVPRLKDEGLLVIARQVRWWSWTGIVRVPERIDAGEGGEGEGEGEAGWENVKMRLKGVQRSDGDFILGKIFMAPSKSRGAAIIYQTGTKSFVQLLEHKAEKLGLYFNQTGLWKWHPSPLEEIVGVSIYTSHPASTSTGPSTSMDEDDADPDLDESTLTKNQLLGRKARGQLQQERALEKVVEKEPRAEGFWQLLPSEDEEAIFERLGMEFVPTERRGVAL